MTLLPADYALGALVIVCAALGLFRGFSGTLAFFLAGICAGVTAVCGWPYSATLTPVLWMRGAGVLVATLLCFGLVRAVVKKCVNGLLAQPTDAVFGALVGSATGALVIFVWAKTGLHLEYSNLAAAAAGILGGI